MWFRKRHSLQTLKLYICNIAMVNIYYLFNCFLLIAYCLSSRSRIIQSYAEERLQNLDLCSPFFAIEQWRIFIMPISVMSRNLNFHRSNRYVVSYDKQGVLKTYSDLPQQGILLTGQTDRLSLYFNHKLIDCSLYKAVLFYKIFFYNFTLTISAINLLVFNVS